MLQLLLTVARISASKNMCFKEKVLTVVTSCTVSLKNVSRHLKDGIVPREWSNKQTRHLVDLNAMSASNMTSNSITKLFDLNVIQLCNPKMSMNAQQINAKEILVLILRQRTPAKMIMFLFSKINVGVLPTELLILVCINYEKYSSEKVCRNYRSECSLPGQLQSQL